MNFLHQLSTSCFSKFDPLDRDGQKQRLAGIRTVFPNIALTLEEIIAEGDRVVFVQLSRPHQKYLQGIAQRADT